MPDHLPKNCPVCATAIPAGFPDGLCPKCLLGQAAPESGAGRAEAPMEGWQRPGGQAMPAAPTVEALQRLFQDLEILNLLGTGGMGAVYKARQVRLNRLVALKIMVCPQAREAGFALRFEREAQALARLNHPNIVTVHDVGCLPAEPTGGGGSLYYLLMEYVDGMHLGELMRGGALAPATVLSLVPPLCDALQYAHDQGITHRDIKPANILLDANGTVKIADFGLAKMAAEADSPAMTGLTQTGETLGTFHYMAPEQWEPGAATDHRADLYSLGVVCYEMLTGEKPAGVFQPPSALTPGLDRRLDAVVLKALSKNPARRYQQAGEIKKALAQVRLRPEGKTTGGRPGRLGWFLAAGGVAAAAGFLSFQGGDPQGPAVNEAPMQATPHAPADRSPGRLKAAGTLRHGRQIDLSKAQGMNDFTQVVLHDSGWVALRAGGQTVSSDGRGERSGIVKICPANESRFALMDEHGRMELIGLEREPQDFHSQLPEEAARVGVVDVAFDAQHGLALLQDGTVCLWGNHYDHPDRVPAWMGQQRWQRPAEAALREVRCIAMTPLSASTITRDGRLWTWGGPQVSLPAAAEAFQGQYEAVVSTSSGLYDARLRDGRILCFNLSMRDAQARPASLVVQASTYGGYRPLHQRGDGTWFAAWPTPGLPPLLPALHGLPATRFSVYIAHEGGEKLSIGLLTISGE